MGSNIPGTCTAFPRHCAHQDGSYDFAAISPEKPSTPQFQNRNIETPPGPDSRVGPSLVTAPSRDEALTHARDQNTATLTA